MLIHGSPLPAKLPEDLGVGDRFWYWRGASGRNYIHSIYATDACPPLPGAVFVAVRRIGGLRTAVSVGRFPSFWDNSAGDLAEDLLRGLATDEIHVHLLARNELAAQEVLADLQRAMHELPLPSDLAPGFNDLTQAALLAA